MFKTLISFLLTFIFLFFNINGEKWPYWLGDNPDVGVSDYGHLLFRSRSEPTKIWNTFEDAEKWVE